MAAGVGGRASEQHPEQSPSTPVSVGAGDPSEFGSDAALHSHDEIEMVRKATEVLGIDRVAAWMRTRIPSLGNQTPYVLIQTEDGRKQVDRVLLKIEHGVY
jgi:uncharacterized protein (DUF2384 family)